MVTRAVIEILILWFLIYRVMLFLEGTRAFYVIRGLVILLVVFLISNLVGLTTISFLLGKLFGISILVLVILFHPELRQVLARLGQSPFWGAPFWDRRQIEKLSRDITIAVNHLAERRIGALIAIQRSIGLKTYASTGIMLDAIVSPELIETIFSPRTPLHDGGMIIKDGRIFAVGCLFPLTDSERHPSIRGTRHRAGIGMSEETDAICIIVSEEEGTVSWAIDGRLRKGVTPEELYKFLVEQISYEPIGWWQWVLEVVYWVKRGLKK